MPKSIIDLFEKKVTFASDDHLAFTVHEGMEQLGISRDEVMTKFKQAVADGIAVQGRKKSKSGGWSKAYKLIDVPVKKKPRAPR